MRRLFIESSLFSREIKRLIKENKLSEDDYKKFQEELLNQDFAVGFVARRRKPMRNA